MDKQKAICLDNEILSSSEKEWTTDACVNMDESWKKYTDFKSQSWRIT